MSSLRVSDHPVPIDAPATGGDSARPETANDGGSFAAALDAVGGADAGTSSLGRAAGDASDGPATPSEHGGEPTAKKIEAPAILADAVGAALIAATSAEANAAGGGPVEMGSPGAATGDSATARPALGFPFRSAGLTALSNDALRDGAAVPAQFAAGSAPTPDAAGPILSAPVSGVPVSSVPVSIAPVSIVSTATTSDPGTAGKSRTDTNRFETMAAVTPAGVPAAPGEPSVPEKAIVATGLAGDAPEGGASLGRTDASSRDRTPFASPTSGSVPSVVSSIGPTPGAPAVAGIASPSPINSADNIADALSFTADPAVAALAGPATGAKAVAPAAVPTYSLAALDPMPASSNPLAEVAPALSGAVAAPTADAGVGGRVRLLQPLGAAPEAAAAPNSAVWAPFAGTEAASTAASAAPNLAPGPTAECVSDQVAAHLVRLVASGSRDMVMRLRPPELGDVTVRVAVNGRDVSAWFASPQPQVQSAISAAIGQLQTSLGDAGYNLSGAWVGGGGADAQQQRPYTSGEAPARNIPASTAVAPMAAAQRPATSGLNIYV